MRELNAKNKHSKGMTLLEILLALSLFAFMFIFISQMLRQSYRQARKIKQDIDSKSSLSHILELMRQDFQAVSYQLDLNENLNRNFPIESPLPSKEQEVWEVEPKKKQNSDQPSIFLSPYFVFDGKEQEVQFSSYSFSRSTNNPSQTQWIKIHYFIQSCDSLEENSSGSCLFRAVNYSWEPEKPEEPEETLVLLRDLKSLNFFYADTNDILNGEWQDRWLVENQSVVNSPLLFPTSWPFPTAIKMEIEKSDSKLSFIFPISHFYLKTWNSYTKDFINFPVLAPFKKSDQEKASQGGGPVPESILGEHN